MDQVAQTNSLKRLATIYEKINELNHSNSRSAVYDYKVHGEIEKVVKLIDAMINVANLTLDHHQTKISQTQSEVVYRGNINDPQAAIADLNPDAAIFVPSLHVANPRRQLSPTEGYMTTTEDDKMLNATPEGERAIGVVADRHNALSIIDRTFP
eukprot:649191_1